MNIVMSIIQLMCVVCIVWFDYKVCREYRKLNSEVVKELVHLDRLCINDRLTALEDARRREETTCEDKVD